MIKNWIWSKKNALISGKAKKKDMKIEVNKKMCCKSKEGTSLNPYEQRKWGLDIAHCNFGVGSGPPRAQALPALATTLYDTFLRGAVTNRCIRWLLSRYMYSMIAVEVSKASIILPRKQASSPLVPASFSRFQQRHQFLL